MAYANRQKTGWPHGEQQVAAGGFREKGRGDKGALELASCGKVGGLHIVPRPEDLGARSGVRRIGADAPCKGKVHFGKRSPVDGRQLGNLAREHGVREEIQIATYGLRHHQDAGWIVTLGSFKEGTAVLERRDSGKPHNLAGGMEDAGADASRQQIVAAIEDVGRQPEGQPKVACEHLAKAGRTYRMGAFQQMPVHKADPAGEVVAARMDREVAALRVVERRGSAGELDHLRGQRGGQERGSRYSDKEKNPEGEHGRSPR